MFAKGISTKGGDVFRDEKSLAFDGSNDYVDCGSDSSLDVGTNDFSVSAWCKVSTKGGSDYHDIVAKGNTLGSGDGWGICLVESNNTIFFDTNGDVARQNAISPSDSWEFGKWYHIVGTRSNSADTLKLYLNGVLVATNASATNDDLGDASINFKIGTSESGRETKGNISEVAIYNSALTINQVKTIYNGREPYNHKEGVASGNLQAWYRMGDGVLDSKHLAETDTQAISDMVTPTLGNDLFDADAYASGTGGWEVYSNNTVENDSGAIKITYVDSASGAYLYLRNAKDLSSDLTVGKLYKIKFDAKVNTGSVTFEVVTASGSNGPTWVVTNTDFSTIEGYFKAGHTTNCYLRAKSMGAGEIAYWNNITLQEVGGNAAIMQNMSNVDFEGDTP